MKVRNAVRGMKVQVKRDCRGHLNEFIKKGLVCTIKWIDEEDDEGYEFSLVHPDIDGGFAWVNASDVRRYIKPTESPEPIVKLTKGTKVRVKSTVVGDWSERLQEGDVYILNKDEDVACGGTSRRLDVSPVGGGSSWITQLKYFDVLPDEVPEEPQDDIQVGDSVLVGSEGAGFGYVRKEYAGLVCSVVDKSYRDDCVEISHPDVMGGTSYTSRKEYLTKVDPKPKELTLADIQVGDWVVCSSGHSLITGVAYKVVGFTGWGSLLVSNPSERHANWVKGYAIQPCYFNKVLREVQPEPKYKYIPCTIDNTNVGDIVRCVDASGFSSSDLNVGGTYRVQENDRSSVPFELVDKGTGDYIAWVLAHRVEKKVEVCTNQNG